MPNSGARNIAMNSFSFVPTWVSDVAGDEGEPLPPRLHPINAAQAGLTMFKAVVGPSILYLPAAIMNAGLASAVPITLVTGAVSTKAVCLLLDAASELRRQGHAVTGIGDVGEVAFGRTGRIAVNVSVVLVQLGYCTGYCVFVGENVQAIIFEAYGGKVGEHGDGAACALPAVLADDHLVYWIICVLMPMLIPLTWIRQLRSLSLSNLVASILIAVSVAFMLGLFGAQLLSHGPEEIHAYSPEGTLTYIGTAMYAFEGIGVVLPVEQSMADPSKMPLVACWAMLGACAFQLLAGVMAYLVYGAHTQPIVTVSLGDGSMYLPGGEVAVQAVQVAWVIAVLLTFPLQMLPAARIIEGGFAADIRSGRKVAKNVLRSSLLLCCMVVSIFGYSSVDNMVAIVGAVACVPLAMVYPAFFHFKVCVLPWFRSRLRPHVHLRESGGPGCNY